MHVLSYVTDDYGGKDTQLNRMKGCDKSRREYVWDSLHEYLVEKQKAIPRALPPSIRVTDGFQMTRCDTA